MNTQSLSIVNSQPLPSEPTSPLTVVDSKPLPDTAGNAHTDEAALPSRVLNDPLHSTNPVARAAESMGKDILNAPSAIWQMIAHPLNTLAADAESRNKILNDAKASLSNGEYVKGIVNGTASAIPFLGPILSDMGDAIQKGDTPRIAENAGHIAAMGLLSKIAEVAPSVASDPAVGTALSNAAKATTTTAKAAIRAIPDPLLKAAIQVPSTVAGYKMAGFVGGYALRNLASEGTKALIEWADKPDAAPPSVPPSVPPGPQAMRPAGYYGETGEPAPEPAGMTPEGIAAYTAKNPQATSVAPSAEQPFEIAHKQLLNDILAPDRLTWDKASALQKQGALNIARSVLGTQETPAPPPAASAPAEIPANAAPTAEPPSWKSPYTPPAANPIPESYQPQTESGLQNPHSANRLGVVNQAAKQLHANGITTEDLAAMENASPANKQNFWEKVGNLPGVSVSKAENYRMSDPETIQDVKDALADLEAKGGTKPKTPTPESATVTKLKDAGVYKTALKLSDLMKQKGQSQ